MWCDFCFGSIRQFAVGITMKASAEKQATTTRCPTRNQTESSAPSEPILSLAFLNATDRFVAMHFGGACRLDLTNFSAYFLTMKTMNVSEAKTHFSSVVDWVAQGETVLICKRNLPVAKISGLPVEGSEEKHHTVIGWAKGSGARILSDLTEPFLAEGDWEMMR
jgi:prevent-host-death family protein